MKTKILISLQHNDHLVWTAFREIDPSHARLMTQEELDTLSAASEEVLRRIIRKEYGTEDRPLVERKKKK